MACAVVVPVDTGSRVVVVGVVVGEVVVVAGVAVPVGVVAWGRFGTAVVGLEGVMVAGTEVGW